MIESRVTDSTIGADATVGPFTFIRPGTSLAAKSKAGAFVELKSAQVGEGSKVPHLSYVGDAVSIVKSSFAEIAVDNAELDAPVEMALTAATFEPLMLNVNSAATVGVVDDVSKGKVHCMLKLPVCAEPGSKVSISRRVENRFRLIGYGIIKGE